MRVPIGQRPIFYDTAKLIFHLTYFTKQYG